MSWCLQCGSSGTPERAVGWDEDGEPACGMHRLKAERPLILAPAIESPPMIAEPIQKPAAAPSPVQTSAKETVMVSAKQCVCGCKTDFLPTGNRQLYAPGHKPIKPKTNAKSAKSGKSLNPISARPDLRQIVGIQVPTDSGEAHATFGTHHFSEKQLNQFWRLLSPGSKAEAIDRLLEIEA